MFKKVKLFWKKKAAKFSNSALFHYLLALVFVVGGLMTMAAIVLCNDIQTNNATQMFGYDMYYRDDMEMFEGGMPSISGIDDVLVLENCGWDDLDTAPGILCCVSDTIPESFDSCCITNDVLADWEMIICECGGYDPIGTRCWTLEVWQGKSGSEVKVGEIKVNIEDWPLPPCAPCECCCSCMRLTFYIPEDGCIHLDSNYFPNLMNCDCSMDWCNMITSGAANLDKFVDLKLKTKWAGCELQAQEFRVILAQEYQVPQKI